MNRHWVWPVLGLFMVSAAGCAALTQGGVGETMTTISEGLNQAAPFVPPPWNWAVMAVAAALGLGGTEVTRRSVKNSPEGKIFGPIKKKKDQP